MPRPSTKLTCPICFRSKTSRIVGKWLVGEFLTCPRCDKEIGPKVREYYRYMLALYRGVRPTVWRRWRFEKQHADEVRYVFLLLQHGIPRRPETVGSSATCAQVLEEFGAWLATIGT